MKRILQVVSTLEQGGMEAVILNYFAEMPKDEILFDFLVIYGDKKGYHEDFLLSQGCKIFKMQNPPNRYFAHGKELKQFFARENYQIVHIHAMTSLRYRVAEIAKKSGVATVIYHSHNSSNERHLWLHKLLKSKLNKWCDYKFACSDIAGKYMYKGRYRLIHNAIDLRHFAYKTEYREELRARYGLANRLVIGNVARLTEVKNQKYLLKVARYLKQSIPDFVIFCIGDGIERERLSAFAAQNGLEDHLILAGTVGADVYKYYSMFDCLAFPSKFEGLSMVLIEAQANGLPIVASEDLSGEHKIAENFWFLPIDESEQAYMAWATWIRDHCAFRKNNGTLLRNAGYDIQAAAGDLKSFYVHLR